VLPLHPFSAPRDGSTPAGGHGRVRALVLTSFSVAVVTAVVGGATGLLVLAVAATGLAAAAVLVLRTHRGTAHDAPARARIGRTVFPAAGAPESVDPEELTALLRRLHDDHVEQVNMALAEDREDLVQELSDSYMDESLALITATGRRSPEFFSIN
jgi:hypothetical protein